MFQRQTLLLVYSCYKVKSGKQNVTGSEEKKIQKEHKVLSRFKLKPLEVHFVGFF